MADITEIETKALADIDAGYGWSTDRILARYYSVARKTIWDWSKTGKLPEPKKISPNRTRWNNAEIKAHNERVNNLKANELLGELYGES
jgi:predicted DNA-binding transcriptional regulator AlpA